MIHTDLQSLTIIMTLYVSITSSGATKDIDWLGPQGLDLHGIKERGN